jgi:hypothetical protein
MRESPLYAPNSEMFFREHVRTAHGGAINGRGSIIVDGMLYTNSGYGRRGQGTGKVSLAFETCGADNKAR